MPPVDLTQHPVKPTEYGRWQQLNGPLGVEAFGVNAIVLRPGRGQFDIEHDEAEHRPSGGVRCRLRPGRFTIGDERVEAGPGMVVSAPDPRPPATIARSSPARGSSASARAPVAKDAYGEWIDEAEPVGH